MLGNTEVLQGLEAQMKRQRDGTHDVDSMDSPVELQPVSNDPITLHMVEDSKAIYQAIGKMAGLNVIFDADYTSKRIPVDLTNISLPDALRIVEKVSGTFWTPVTSNTIFVAQNSRTKHNDLDDLAVETFYLTNVSQQNDANEVLVALRNVLVDPDLKIYLVASQNAIILRATPDELALADKLIHDLDRTRPEVVVDIAVLEVSRTLERNLGITLPTSFGLTPQASNQNINNNSNNNSSSSSSNSSNSNPLSSLTLNTLGNLNATNFAVSLSGGQLNALLSDDGTRILQNPRVRATDGQPATLKIGQRVPVATGSFNSGVGASIGGIGGIQTQFTYQDVGVNIDLTPTVHNDDEVSLKLKIDVSTEQAPQSVGGISQPVFGQRSVQQVIQLKNGEPSMLAGLVQQQDISNITGTPGLGELPFFKYFFSSRDKTQMSDEIVFLLIPHIVRESIVTDENTRIIDTGTSQQIELHHGSRDKARAAETSDLGSGDLKVASQHTSAANAASAMLSQIAAQSRPVLPDDLTATAGSPQGSASIDFEMVPQVMRQSVGSTFQVSVSTSNAHDLFAVPLQLKFDPKVLSLVDVDSGELLNRDGQAVAVVHRAEGSGLVAISASRPPKTAGVNGQGTVFTITFKALAAGDSPLSLIKIGAQDSKQVSLPAFSIPGLVHVK
jgi:general secretion pathway protein D